MITLLTNSQLKVAGLGLAIFTDVLLLAILVTLWIAIFGRGFK